MLSFRHKTLDFEDLKCPGQDPWLGKNAFKLLVLLFQEAKRQDQGEKYTRKTPLASKILKSIKK